jgi:hypothetical protein
MGSRSVLVGLVEAPFDTCSVSIPVWPSSFVEDGSVELPGRVKNVLSQKVNAAVRAVDMAITVELNPPDSRYELLEEIETRNAMGPTTTTAQKQTVIANATPAASFLNMSQLT